MAQAKRKEKATLQQALQDAFVTPAPATVTPAPEAKGNVIQHPALMVYDGPQMVDARKAPVVHAPDVLQAGAALKNLAFNMLAGVADPALFDKDAKCWSLRSIKNEKSAFFKLIAQSPEKIRDAWRVECETRKNKPNGRITQVSLQALAKLFKTERAGGGESPYTKIKARLEKLKADILIIVNSKLQKDVKLRKIAEMCAPDEDAEKAE